MTNLWRAVSYGRYPTPFLRHPSIHCHAGTGTADAFIEEITSRTAIRAITAKVAVLANQLPATFSSDPCDRLIGGTALAEGITLVTKDRTIRDCKAIKTIW